MTRAWIPFAVTLATLVPVLHAHGQEPCQQRLGLR